MKTLAVALLAVLFLGGCKVHSPIGHPHGAPPGQVKKAYRCGTCGVTKSVAGNCHGKVMVLVP